MGATRLGYVGLGTIGLPVATRLAALPDVTLFVADLNASALDTLAQLPNVTVVDTPAEVARESEVLFACLPNPAAGNVVFLGAGGVVEAGSDAAGLIVIDNSTVSPSAAERWSRGLAALHIHYFECPVLGGVTQAIDGELFGIVSGPELQYADTVSTLLPVFTKDHRYVGATVGTASRMKTIQNGLGLVQWAGIVEALGIIAKGGADVRVVSTRLPVCTVRIVTVVRHFSNILLQHRMFYYRLGCGTTW
jgi:3-hydroxyisobutyrate dehydrogenase-like beta-hydroxyacid dehydrogenase